MKCGAENIYMNGRDGVLCSYCNGYLLIVGETDKPCKALLAKKIASWETPNIYKPIYCEEKETGEIFLVTSLNFPIGSGSGKDLTVKTKDGYEWRSIDDVFFLEYELGP